MQQIEAGLCETTALIASIITDVAVPYCKLDNQLTMGELLK